SYYFFKSFKRSWCWQSQFNHRKARALVMLELSSRYKFSAFALAFALHVSVFAVFVWNSSFNLVGGAEDIGSGGIEISLASIAEKPKPAAKSKTIEKLVEKKDSL